MARLESRYVCGTCGASSLRWEGQCRGCGGWNTLVETPLERRASAKQRRGAPAAPTATPLSAVQSGDSERGATGIAELDRVLGGGLVPGSVVLLGGEPGIGKSTLVLALCGALIRRSSSDASVGASAGRILYASGEESPAQVGLRARRLGLGDSGVAARIDVLAETGVERIVAGAEAIGPALLVVDSIQTLTSDELEGPAGSVGQVRSAASRLQAYAKENAVPVVLVGHVTKDGSLAGPKALEHLVDVVLTLEGERSSGLRLLRSGKNRFGSTEEVGVFEMAAHGLAEVADPAAVFIDRDSLGAPGVAVAATLEGTRSLLVEVQALVTPAVAGSPRRTAAGVDGQRLALLLAVLGRRAGINLASHDVYVKLVGGLTVEEPAIDLPLAVALASALRDMQLPPATVFCGEVGLTGELRPVAGLDRRLREAARLGFERAVVARPAARARSDETAAAGIEAVHVSSLRDALAVALGAGNTRAAGAATATGAAIPVVGGPPAR